ncbi:MAG: hypothetical protein M3P11_06975 [Actinomycetota bacterium]|nr:hypothetical protein [Actinomycetota bacterium]
MTDKTQADFVRAVEAEYVPLRNDLFADPELREALQPLDAAREVIVAKAATLATIREEHAAGRLADSQVPRLRATLAQEMATAQDAADRAARARLAALPAQLAERAFPTPPRGPQTAEAKADLQLRLGTAEDLHEATLDALDAATRSGDSLSVQLLASDWGADYLATRTDRQTARAVRDEVRARVSQTPDVLPEDRRKDVARMARLADLHRAFDAGLNLVDMERQAAERS